MKRIAKRFYKKPRTQCPRCTRTVSVKENGALNAHTCNHGNQCVEANSGAEVLDCQRCANLQAVAS